MPEEPTPPVTQSMSSVVTPLNSASAPPAQTQTGEVKPGEVQVFGQHLMVDLKLRMGVPETGTKYNTSSRDDNKCRDILTSYQNSTQEDEAGEECAVDNSKQTNPWISKKSLYFEGPFTVKYPDTSLTGVGNQSIGNSNGYHSDIGRYPMRRFDELGDYTNAGQPEVGRYWARDLEDTTHHVGGQWGRGKPKHLNPYNYGLKTNTCVNPQANTNAAHDFRKLGLSDNQIIGLKNLGFHVPKIESHANLGYPEDPRIPPSFELAGALCWWCECAEHISYGVARLLEDDPAVVGIDLEWKTSKNSTSYNKVALIQIAKADTVLLIPTNSRDHSAPKALHILFQDPKIVKVGVGVEGDLLKLWRDFQIDANSYTELNDLVLLSRFDLGINPKEPTKFFGLEQMANLVGYPKWKNKDIACSNWENRPLSWDQLHYAALDALMGTRIFWRMLMGSKKVSMRSISAADLRANIETFVEPVCRRVPISLLDKEQRIAKLKREGLYPGCSWERPSNSDVKNVRSLESHERSSTTGGSTSGDSSGVLDETHTRTSKTRFNSNVKRTDSEYLCLSKGFGLYNDPAERFGASTCRPASKSNTTSELPLVGTHQGHHVRSLSDWKQGCPSIDPSDGTGKWGGFHLPINVTNDL